MSDTKFSLNQFHAINAERCRTTFAPPHGLMALVACVQEEVGELAAAVLGVTGEKKRKAHLTNHDVLDAVADAMTYLSLLATEVGCTDLEGLLARTFNMVSERAGSHLRVPCRDLSSGAEVADLREEAVLWREDCVQRMERDR
jgi:NTP pyrophosphatase (non-canonical NTP hydrolase)